MLLVGRATDAYRSARDQECGRQNDRGFGFHSSVVSSVPLAVTRPIAKTFVVAASYRVPSFRPTSHGRDNHRIC
jgi:hypothetical protein